MRIYYWHGKGPLAWLVRTWTRSRWDHVALGLQIGGVPCYIESVPMAGVRIVPLSLDPPDGYQAIRTEWNPTTLHHAIEALGKPYSLADCILVGLGLKPLHHGMECAELVAYILKLKVTPTPQHIAEALGPVLPYKE